MKRRGASGCHKASQQYFSFFCVFSWLAAVEWQLLFVTFK